MPDHQALRRALGALVLMAMAGCAAASQVVDPDPFGKSAAGPQEIRIHVENLNFNDARLYAVALAHRYPRWIRQVITLGTPYGDPRGTALYSVMGNLYDNDVAEDALERWVAHTYSGGTLRVPVLALYSESDGIVGAGIARCQGDPQFVTNMAVVASHVGFPFNPLVFAVIANHLVEPHLRWALCRSAHIQPLVRVVPAN